MIIPMCIFFKSYIKRGLFSFTYGSKDSLVEFLHVDNLVQAHVLAGEALSSQKKRIAVCLRQIFLLNFVGEDSWN
jgi:nucleoside-diphosphate-sugar epimerase